MKLSEASKYLPFVQAAAEGKTIQYKRPDKNTWRDMYDSDFYNPPEAYRIKPQEESEAAKFRALWEQGKKVEFSFDNGQSWLPICYLFLNIDNNAYLDKNYVFRLAQEPILRPWKPEEVPVGALIRTKSCCNYPSLILCVNVEAITISNFNPVQLKVRLENLTEYEHSLDHGVTWLPCGVME